MPYIGRSEKMGVRTVFHYLASNGTTSISGADVDGKTLTFADGNYIDVYLNGVRLKKGEDFNTSTANTVAGLAALNANDEVNIVVYDAFSIADVVPASSGGSFGGNISLTSDSAVLSFGVDSDIKITHDPDDGLFLKSTATADDNPFVLTLQTGETDIAQSDVLGTINFQAPDEGTGTDAILVAAGIEAVSEGDFSSSNNATKLSFKTAASEAAAEKMSLSSAGLLTIADDLVIGDGKTIGSASDADAIAIAANGVVTFSQAPVFPDGSINIADIDLDGGTDIGAAIVDADLFLIDDGAGGTMRKTTASRMSTYFGGGKVLQVQHSAQTTEVSSNSDSTYTDTGTTDDITPANASNKVLVQVSQHIGCGDPGGPAVASIRLLRGTTVIENWNNNSCKEAHGGNFMFAHLDSPSTTSATTYHTEFKRTGDSLGGTIYINDDRQNATDIPNSTITLLEIDGT